MLGRGRDEKENAGAARRVIFSLAQPHRHGDSWSEAHVRGTSRVLRSYTLCACNQRTLQMLTLNLECSGVLFNFGKPKSEHYVVLVWLSNSSEEPLQP